MEVGNSMDGLEIAKNAYKLLDDKKGENIVLLDVRGQSPITDYIMIVSGGSDPHIKALFDAVQRGLKKAGLHCHRKSGTTEGGWMILDYFDVIIHIFSEEARNYYAIEEIWSEATEISLE